jgi:hypothetical protein
MGHAGHLATAGRRLEVELTIGYFDQEVVAALAYDLVARVMGEDVREYNFSDEMLKDLVPIYGNDILEGLNEELPRRLREAVARQVERFSEGP